MKNPMRTLLYELAGLNDDAAIPNKIDVRHWSRSCWGKVYDNRDETVCSMKHSSSKLPFI
jgi:hypothetical protein